MPEVVPSEPAVPVAPKVVLVRFEELFVVSRLTWETGGDAPHPLIHPVSDSTMLLPPVPAVFAVRVNGFAAAPGATVGCTPATFLKQGGVLPHWVESFSMAARRLVVVVRWPGGLDPPSSTALASGCR